MISIVTDTTVYLKKSEALALDIKIVPISYFADHHRLYESYSDSNGNFETLLDTCTKFSTASPGVSAYLSCFEEILNSGKEVLCITISSRLSGAYRDAFSAAKMLKSSKIAVLDSQLTAGGMYLLVKEAVRLTKSTMPLSEITRELQGMRKKIVSVFTVDDMTPLRNSGRIGLVRHSVGTILNIKPILLCKDGMVISDSIAHGNENIIKNLVSRVPKNAAIKEFAINYISNVRLAANLCTVLKARHPDASIKIAKLGPVLGIHLGLGVVALSFMAT